MLFSGTLIFGFSTSMSQISRNNCKEYFIQCVTHLYNSWTWNEGQKQLFHDILIIIPAPVYWLTSELCNCNGLFILSVRENQLYVSCHCQDVDPEATRGMEAIIMGIYVIIHEGAEPDEDPEDVGIVIEGVEVLHGLRNTANACALLLGLIYCLNLSYPKELKSTFEFLQKVIMELDGSRLSTKVQVLKNRLFQWSFQLVSSQHMQC